ncbi:MAG TPA: hypothetical protein VGT02_12380 [Methylomirabilota bacterium]|jgi:hypothetical protein|nr:hypothetical protein [Methylomirabilota bacterium]
MRVLTASLVAAGALCLSVGAASAHTDQPVPKIDAVPAASRAAPGPMIQALRRAGTPPATLLPVVVVAAALIAAGSSRRRFSLALALLSAVIGVDAAVHSVHHLHDPGAAAACALASGSTHAPAVLTTAIVVAVAPEPGHDRRADATTPAPTLRASRPDRGRAPPSSAA